MRSIVMKKPTNIKSKCTLIHPESGRKISADIISKDKTRLTVRPVGTKVEISNVIFSKKVPQDTNLTYYDVLETGTKIDSTVLNWIILWSLRENLNIIYSVGGERHCLGSEKFYNEIVKITS
jgi:hypothetical protein